MERFIAMAIAMRRGAPQSTFGACLAAVAMIEYGTRGTTAARAVLRKIYHTDDLILISQIREAIRLGRYFAMNFIAA